MPVKGPRIWMQYTGQDSSQTIEDVLDEKGTARRCVGDGKPFPTLLRHQTYLENTGLFRRVAISEDKARTHRHLPDEGRLLIGQHVKLPTTPRARVLMLAYCEPGYSGARLYDQQLALALARAGVHVHRVVNRLPDWLPEWPDHENITWEVSQGAKTKYRGFHAVIGCPPQCLHRALVEARKFAIPCWLVVYEPGKWLIEALPGIQGALDPQERDHYEQADGIISCSEMSLAKTLEWIGRGHSSSDLCVRPILNFDIAASVDEMEMQDELVFIGRGIDQKGWKELDKAVRGHERAYKMTWIGLDVRKIGKGKQDAEKHPQEHLQNASEADKWRAIRRCRMGALLSKHEGFGMVPAEFLYAGKPFVAAENEQLRAVYGDRLLYCDPGDQMAIRAAIDRAWDSEISDETRAWAFALMDPGRMVRDLEGLPELIRERSIAKWTDMAGGLPERVAPATPTFVVDPDASENRDSFRSFLAAWWNVYHGEGVFYVPGECPGGLERPGVLEVQPDSQGIARLVAQATALFSCPARDDGGFATPLHATAMALGVPIIWDRQAQLIGSEVIVEEKSPVRTWWVMEQLERLEGVACIAS